MDKEIAGQPLWLWLTGAVVIVGGYLYFRSHSAAASSAGQGAQTGGTGKSTSQSSFKEWITQHQGAPSKPPPKPAPPPLPPPKPPPHKRHRRRVNPGGPNVGA